MPEFLNVSDDEEMAEWDALMDSLGADFSHASWWMRSYARIGLSTDVVAVRRNGKLVGGSGVTCIRLPVLGSSGLMVPYGPSFVKLESDVVEEWFEGIRELAKRRRGFLVQIEGVESQELYEEIKKQIPPAAFSADRCWRVRFALLAQYHVSLREHTEETLLAHVNRRCRQNIRRNLSSGMEVVCASGEEDLRAAYALWARRASAKSFDLRPFGSLAIAMLGSIRCGHGMVLLGRYRGQLAAAIYVILFGGRATYAVGGLEATCGAIEPTYGLHWHAMRECLHRGMRYYSLGPDVTGGVGQFKRSFNPEMWQCNNIATWRINRPLVWCAGKIATKSVVKQLRSVVNSALRSRLHDS